jgi:hypothetical protein
MRVPAAVWEDVESAVNAAEGAPATEPGELAGHLYAEWYLGVGGATAAERPATPDPTDLNLVDALRAVHADSERWENGGEISGVSNRGRIAVSHGERRRIATRVDVLPERHPCLAPRPGEPTRFTARRDSVDETGAFWFTWCGDWNEDEIPSDLVRMYWHVPRRQTPALVRSLTAHLASAGCSYAMKIAVEDREAERVDRAVVYLTPDAVPRAAPALRSAYHDVAHRLRDTVPRLTLRLAPGLSVAEDPGSGESFGQHRCRLIAEALAAAEGCDRSGRALAVLRRFTEEGIDPAYPHLRPGSHADLGALAP